jgi:hypothetical protein
VTTLTEQKKRAARKPGKFAAGVGRGLRLSAKDARETARRFGMSIYIWKDGKVVAKKP